MKAPSNEKTQAVQKKKKSTKRSKAALATCPVNGAGWCPYPFSPEQLERRLKALAESESEKQLVKTGR